MLILAACAAVPSVNAPGSAATSPIPEDNSPSIELKPGDGVQETEGTPPAPLPTPTLEPTSTNIAPSAQDFVALGNQAYYSGQLDVALAYYSQALAMEPGDIRVYLGLGQIYIEQGDYDQAWEALNRALEINPLSAEAYDLRGQLSYELGNRQQALEDFSRAIEVNPLYGLAYQNRALVQQELGFPEAAIIDLQVYLALAPDAADLEIVEELMARLLDQTLPFTADREGRLFADDFSDYTSGWLNNPDPFGLASYNSGGYRINIPVAERAVWGTNDFWARDIRIEVDARKIGGSDNNLIGVMCRYQDIDNFYVFVISSDGYYGVGKRVNGGPLEPTSAGQLQFSREVRQGDALNHISVECMGDQLRLYVNHDLLLTATDASIPAGAVGLLAATYAVQGTDIMFDNFEIYETPKEP
ncbi:MAG: tetratricopeptide repeat protein [Chloroflexi bacterium]|nr:tetratricopeptide repeat protein [Chloroflexota bacterium]